jgi:hypothetical protein
MLNADGVAMVKGTPPAFAARARISSAPKRPALMPPVGAMASGRFDGFPKISVSGRRGDVDQHLGQQPHPLEGGAVVAQGGPRPRRRRRRSRRSRAAGGVSPVAQVLDIDRLQSPS